MGHVNELPPELLVKIFDYFIESEGHGAFLKNVALVCKDWHDLSSNGSLWGVVSVNCYDEKDLRNFLKPCDKGLFVATQSLRINENHPQNYSFSCTYDMTKVFLGCPNLRDLQLHCLTLTPVSLENLIIWCPCPHLESLKLQYIQFDVEEKLNYRGAHPANLLIPVIYTWGKNLKRLAVKYIRILRGNSSGENNEPRLFSSIMQCCTSLEELEYADCASMDSYTAFPLLEIGESCHKLRSLKVDGCKMAFSEVVESHRWFEHLKSFEADSCNFGGQSVHTVFKYSESLEKLTICKCIDVTFTNLSLIPSDNLQILEIDDAFPHDLKFLEDVAAKWKHTLRGIRLHSLKRDVTSVLQNLLSGNPQPVIESLSLKQTAVNDEFLAIFIRSCRNLKDLSLNPYDYWRETPPPAFLLSLYDYAYHPYQYKFPVQELGASCQMIRRLKVIKCEMKLSCSANLYDFPQMESFEIEDCDFHGMDLIALLKNSTHLKTLTLRNCKNVVLSNMSMISSDKVERLKISSMDLGSDVKFLEDAIGKWKHSLKEFWLDDVTHNVTGILRSYLHENHHPLIESLQLSRAPVSIMFLKDFMGECQKLSSVGFMLNRFRTTLRTRIEVENFMNTPD